MIRKISFLFSFFVMSAGFVCSATSPVMAGISVTSDTLQASDRVRTDMDGVTIVSEPSEGKTPALQIFDEKYIPDDMRQQYGIQDDWYGKTNPSVPSVNTVDIAPAPVASPVQEIPVKIAESWRGRKGEKMRDVLQRWSVRGGTSLMWAAEESPVLPKDFSFVGTYQDAVNALIKEVGGETIHSQYRSDGLQPSMMTKASTIVTNSPVRPVTPVQASGSIDETIERGRVADIVDPVPITPVYPDRVKDEPMNENMAFHRFRKEKPEERKSETRWFGLSGAPLAEVMKVWAEDAGVQLIWQTNKNFALKESISRVGQFEDAVYEALSQYESEPVRPVGQIYQDAASGRQVLVVQTDVKS